MYVDLFFAALHIWIKTLLFLFSSMHLWIQIPANEASSKPALRPRKKLGMGMDYHFGMWIHACTYIVCFCVIAEKIVICSFSLRTLQHLKSWSSIFRTKRIKTCLCPLTMMNPQQKKGIPESHGKWSHSFCLAAVFLKIKNTHRLGIGDLSYAHTCTCFLPLVCVYVLCVCV